MGRPREVQKYPHEFLGRCQTCLDNALLSEEPCKPRWGVNGAPINSSECLIFRARQAFDRTAADAFEDAAKVADSFRGEVFAAHQIAAAIRALRPQGGQAPGHTDLTEQSK